MSKNWLIAFVSFLITSSLLAQQNSITLKVNLDEEKDVLRIIQNITYYNNSKDKTKLIYLHNWPNSFENKYSPLGKRFVEDYRKEFQFARPKDRGKTTIHNLKVNYQTVDYNEPINHPDILKIELNKVLNPKDSVVISAEYSVKIPKASFTGFGKTKSGYHLRFWHLIPAVYNTDWQLMSNLNLDDLYMDVADYSIEFTTNIPYYLESNLLKKSEEKVAKTFFTLKGKKAKDVIISLDLEDRFKLFKTTNYKVKTDFLYEKTDLKAAKKIIEKQLNFIQDYLGKYPKSKILIDKNSVGKNSFYDIYGLPRWLKPFPENFKWEMRFLNALTIKYIDDALLLNKRKDYWISDGIQTFLIMEYVKKYYHNTTILGRYSNIWLFKNYNIAKLKQNDKYSFVYQFSARRFFDQPLTTRADSLSNFNKKVVSKYKAALGLRYLQDYVGDSILRNSLKEYYSTNQLKLSNSNKFATILKSKTDKNLDWFFGDYLKTDKKIDYKIKKIVDAKDSLKVTIKNKRSFAAPVALYGVKDKKIKFKKWVTGTGTTKTVTIPKNGYKKLALNYEQLYPEYNALDNFRNTNNSLINKPIQFRFFKDVGDSYYNQIFYQPDVGYNLYDGVKLGVNFNNRSVLVPNFDYSITPNYSTKSNNLTGGFSLGYNQFFRESKIYKIRYGLSGSNFHYAPELSYNRISPFVSIQFRRNTLRDVGSKFLLGRLVYINKEVAQGNLVSESDKYKIFNIRYIDRKPNIIRDIRYALNFEFGNNFTKFSTDIRFRKELTRTNSFEARFFGGIFLSNTSKGDYFSFGLNRGSDYLFEQSLFGRSERSGLFSQQFVLADGGFKSNFNQDSFANQLATSINTNFGIWKWVEIYNDVAMLKNRNQNPRFFYENGVRLNFIPNILEVYFPVYTNQGFQFNGDYGGKVRFVISTSFDRIYNYIRRGIL